MYSTVSCNQMRKEKPIYSYTVCKYWMGRGTLTNATENDYCNFMKRIDEIY